MKAEILKVDVKRDGLKRAAFLYELLMIDIRKMDIQKNVDILWDLSKASHFQGALAVIAPLIKL